MEVTVRLADIPFRIVTENRKIADLVSKYADPSAVPEFEVRADREALDRAQRMRERIVANGGTARMGKTDFGIENIAIFTEAENALALRGVIRIHSSAIAVDGRAYLFIAPGGTGKSTHAALWMAQFGVRAVMINDDKPLVRVVDGETRVYGSPWSGEHRIDNNVSVPLQAAALLSRGDVNEASRIGFGEAMPYVIAQATHPHDPDAAARVLETVNELGKTVPFYSLRCNTKPDAAAVAYGAMSAGRRSAGSDAEGE